MPPAQRRSGFFDMQTGWELLQYKDRTVRKRSRIVSEVFTKLPLSQSSEGSNEAVFATTYTDDKTINSSSEITNQPTSTMILGWFQADDHPANPDKFEIQPRVHHKDYKHPTHGFSKGSQGGSKGPSKG